MYKTISFRSVPKPGPGNRAGFFIARTRGTPKNALGFLGPDAGGPKRKAFSGRRTPKPQNRETSRGVRRMPQFQKGQSGNPAGRPPGSRNRATSMVQRSTTTRRYRASGLQERVRRVVLHRIRDTHTILADQWRHECDANISIIARDLSSARFIGARSASPASSPIAGLARRLPAFMSSSAVRSNPRRSTRGLPISRRSSNSPRPWRGITCAMPCRSCARPGPR